MYVLEGGFREGRHGLVLCWLAAFSVLTKYALRWEDEVAGRGGRGASGGPPDGSA
jgi:hypothetical protein